MCAFLRFPFDSSFNSQGHCYGSLGQRGRLTFRLLLSTMNVAIVQGNLNLTYDNYIARVLESYNIHFP